MLQGPHTQSVLDPVGPLDDRASVGRLGSRGDRTCGQDNRCNCGVQTSDQGKAHPRTVAWS